MQPLRVTRPLPAFRGMPRARSAIGLICVITPLLLAITVERADASTFSTHRSDPAPLAGPKLTPVESKPQTLVERDFDGKIKPLESSPEEAAILLLQLTPAESAKADAAVAARAADMDALVTEHLLDIIRLTGQFQSASALERLNAIRESYKLASPILEKGRLVDRISAALPESQRERYVFLVDAYKRALGDQEIALAKQGKSNDVEFAAEVNKDPKNLIGHRIRARIKFDLESFGKEIQRSAERIIAEKQNQGNDFLGKLQLTPEQEASIQAIYVDVAGKYGLKEPPKGVQAVLFARVLKVLTPEQRKQALVLIREQERQKEKDAAAAKRGTNTGMDESPAPMK
ncbi:MAG: hypothetical protein KGS45_09025 [Planctomycetes bacterium]|nr:hypothetical protein [Planctomycetota bacterium]